MDYGHVLLDERALDEMFAVKLPTEEYYRLLGEDMRERRPDVSPFALEHIESLEALFDVSIVSGFSFGVSKAYLMQVSVEFLSEVAGREVRTVTDRHWKAILDIPEPIKDVPQLRRFLGVVNWVRPHEPAEFGTALRGLTKYLGKGATWPEEAPIHGRGGPGSRQGTQGADGADH